jgi:hypothetical protein
VLVFTVQVVELLDVAVTLHFPRVVEQQEYQMVLLPVFFQSLLGMVEVHLVLVAQVEIFLFPVDLVEMHLVLGVVVK